MRAAVLALVLLSACVHPPAAPPPWWGKSAESADTLFFFGDTAGAKTEEEARRLAATRALANLVLYLGAEVRADERSFELEKNGQLLQEVSVAVEVSGKPRTLRLVRISRAEAVRARAGFDGYAEISWPRAELARARAAEGAEAGRAAALIEQAEGLLSASGPAPALEALDAADHLLASVGRDAPTGSSALPTAQIAREASQALRRRALATKQAADQSAALGARCAVRELGGALRDVACDQAWIAPARRAIEARGLAIVPSAPAAELVAGLLEGRAPAPAASPARWVVALELIAARRASQDFLFAEPHVRVVVLDSLEARVRTGSDRVGEKVGHPTSESAMLDKGFRALAESVEAATAESLKP